MHVLGSVTRSFPCTGKHTGEAKGIGNCEGHCDLMGTTHRNQLPQSRATGPSVHGQPATANHIRILQKTQAERVSVVLQTTGHTEFLPSFMLGHNPFKAQHLRIG